EVVHAGPYHSIPRLASSVGDLPGVGIADGRADPTASRAAKATRGKQANPAGQTIVGEPHLAWSGDGQTQSPATPRIPEKNAQGSGPAQSPRRRHLRGILHSRRR